MCAVCVHTCKHIRASTYGDQRYLIFLELDLQTIWYRCSEPTWVGARTVNPLNGWAITPSPGFPTNVFLLVVFWARKYFYFLCIKSNYLRSTNSTTMKEYAIALHQFSPTVLPTRSWSSSVPCMSTHCILPCEIAHWLCWLLLPWMLFQSKGRVDISALFQTR